MFEPRLEPIWRQNLNFLTETTVYIVVFLDFKYNVKAFYIFFIHISLCLRDVWSQSSPNPHLKYIGCRTTWEPLYYVVFGCKVKFKTYFFHFLVSHFVYEVLSIFNGEFSVLYITAHIVNEVRYQKK